MLKGLKIFVLLNFLTQYSTKMAKYKIISPDFMSIPTEVEGDFLNTEKSTGQTTIYNGSFLDPEFIIAIVPKEFLIIKVVESQIK